MKPTLSWKSFKILLEIDQYIRKYDVHGDYLFQAPSDVCDGSFDRQELDELIRKRIFSVSGIAVYPRDETTICSRGYTVEFTKKAIQWFYPNREQEKPRRPKWVGSTRKCRRSLRRSQRRRRSVA